MVVMLLTRGPVSFVDQFVVSFLAFANVKGGTVYVANEGAPKRNSRVCLLEVQRQSAASSRDRAVVRGLSGHAATQLSPKVALLVRPHSMPQFGGSAGVRPRLGRSAPTRSPSRLGDGPRPFGDVRGHVTVQPSLTLFSSSVAGAGALSEISEAVVGCAALRTLGAALRQSSTAAPTSVIVYVLRCRVRWSEYSFSGRPAPSLASLVGLPFTREPCRILCLCLAESPGSGRAIWSDKTPSERTGAVKNGCKHGDWHGVAARGGGLRKQHCHGDPLKKVIVSRGFRAITSQRTASAEGTWKLTMRVNAARDSPRSRYVG